MRAILKQYSVVLAFLTGSMPRRTISRFLRWSLKLGDSRQCSGYLRIGLVVDFQI